MLRGKLANLRVEDQRHHSSFGPLHFQLFILSPCSGRWQSVIGWEGKCCTIILCDGSPLAEGLPLSKVWIITKHACLFRYIKL